MCALNDMCVKRSVVSDVRKEAQQRLHSAGVLKLFLSAAHYLAMRNIAAHPRIEQLRTSIQAHVSH
jgi:hypothetical protein